MRRPVFLLALALAACVSGPQVAIKRSYDFRKIRRVAVVAFSGTGGDAASDLLAQALLARGADVVERKQLDAMLAEAHLNVSGALDPATVRQIGKLLGVDALFFGSVTSFSPPRNYLVFTEQPQGALPAVTPIESGSIHSSGMAPGVPGADIITSAATVGLNARMVEVESGSLLWSASQTYEGFDVESAMQEVADGFAGSLQSAWLSRLP